jgi:V/A-type H+-transporting ATPase subunit D
MKNERRAMHEGYVFLDEKCLLLAGEILRELAQYTALRAALNRAHAAAAIALQRAIARHGLDGLQVYPDALMDEGSIRYTARFLMGVHLQEAMWQAPQQSGAAPTAVRSPEAEACREAFQALLPHTVALAAVTGNLERLYLEYRRAIRRARALQDVLLPELDRAVYEIQTRLEELEQEDSIWMRHAV